jgi:hypothetical protein
MVSFYKTFLSMRKNLSILTGLLLLGAAPLTVHAQNMYGTPEKDPRWLPTHLAFLQDSADRGLLTQATADRRRKALYKKAGRPEPTTPHLMMLHDLPGHEGLKPKAKPKATSKTRS